MSWAKVDDRFHTHRKALRAWRGAPRALGLHLLAMSYCAGYLTDGYVDEEFVAEKIARDAERRQTTDALVNAGLWVPEPGGWRIHDWLEYNPSRDATLAKRHKDSARKTRGVQTDSTRNPDGIRVASKRPDPTPTTTARDSPKSCGRASANGRAVSLDPLAVLAAEVASILQGAVDGLTSDEPCRAPSPAAVRAALSSRPEHGQALAAAWQARSIAQSQNRAPNIVSLFAQRLAGEAS